MSIHDCLNKILNEWLIETRNPFRGNALAEFIRSGFAGEVRDIVSAGNLNLAIKASPGQGTWADVPWLAILDPEISKTTEDGIYPVYLFRADGSGVYLSLGQGTTKPKKQYGKKEAEKHLLARAAIVREKIPQLSRWAPGPTDLRSNTSLGLSYEIPNIGARLYEKGKIPNEEALIKDLVEMMSIYKDVAKLWPSLDDTERKENAALETMVSSFRQRYPEFKTFENCGVQFRKDEDDYKRDAVDLFHQLFAGWLSGNADSLSGAEFSDWMLKVFRKTNLVDWRCIAILNEKILTSEALLPEFMELCHRLLVLAGTEESINPGLNELVTFIKEHSADSASTKKIPTYLLMLANPEKYIFLKPSLVSRFFKALDLDLMPEGQDLSGENYEQALREFKIISNNLKALHPRDMIDLQSFYYVMTKASDLPDEINEEESMPFSLGSFKQDLLVSGLVLGDEMPAAICSALHSKPFLILTGLSGSGKTQLAQAFSKWICVAEQQRAVVAVGADWTSNENLLGYPDALSPKSYRKPNNGALDLILRAKADPENPYFLILDEMNLSHVERYFADFLSAMESGEAISLHDDTGADWNGVPAKLEIPKNLFVIGTVNVDETTYMFSPKVLDRANVIEFRVSDEEMKSFLENPVKPNLDAIAGQGAQYAKAFVAAATQKDVPLDDTTREAVSKVLMEFFPQLKEAGAEFGYRTAHEICRFVYFHKSLTGEGWEFNSAMDAAIMQKLLPKLHGSKKKLGPILEKLNTLCGARFPASSEKIGRMQKRLAEHGFTSFAEA
jgi:5-methylcytosine-specific restriction protein B